MPKLLEGALAQAIYAGFKGKLLVGTLRRNVPVESAGLDADGDPAATVPRSWPTQGFTDEYSDFSRAQAGIPDTDVKINIFAKSLPAGVRPLKDDMASFTVAGVVSWYQIRRAATDPATALWVCQGFAIPAPPESA